ncbi:hypothetical protein N9D66_00400 [Candidatus Nanopelagicales bacterium]|nr:hypothetical protein [Candidatus Nanopelagicales bacterium]
MDALPPELADMAQAHIDYEVQRWTGANLATSIQAEVAAALAHLNTVPIKDVLTDDVVERAIDLALASPADFPVTDVASAAFAAVQNVLGQSQAGMSDVMSRGDYDRLVNAFIELKQIQRVVIEQVTASQAYSELISHVLYTGIKNYVLKESVVARRMPGASSLMRMGQHALSSAAPNMEKSIDRQLVGFVNANIQDSVRESRQYLATALDPELMRAVAGEFWDSNSDQPFSAAVGLVSGDSVSAIADAVDDIAATVRSSPVSRELLLALARDFLANHPDDSVTEFLAGFGLTQAVMDAAVTKWAPILGPVSEDYVADRIRVEILGFYEVWAQRS